MLDKESGKYNMMADEKFGFQYVSGCFLVFSSKANSSRDVLNELNLASKYGLPIFTFRIEDVEPCPEVDYFTAAWHWIDAITPPVRKHLKDLATKIHALMDPDSKSKQFFRSPAAAGGLSKSKKAKI